MFYDSEVIVVTGAAKGIGEGCADVFLKEGAQLVLLDIDQGGLEAKKAQYQAQGDSVHIEKVDVSNFSEVESTINRVAEKFGDIYGLVNCVGIQTYGTAEETSEDLWDKTLDINLKSMFFTAKAVLPYMKKNKRGAIVNISSVQSLASQKGVVAYSTSKGGINALTRALAIDNAEFGIRVNAILPASVDTPMLRSAAELFSGGKSVDQILDSWGKAHPIGRVAKISEIGDLAAFLCSSRASFITGSSVVIDGGLMGVVPVVLPES
jgi:NAD(P)-dependent dehydrogenase (short-subunit alcohol dehydrogenase family)